MIHIRTDDLSDNTKRAFACGITNLPEGDVWFGEGEAAAVLKADCPGCNPGGPKKLGVPISQLSGRAGHDGFGAFAAIGRSWGYD